MLERLKYKNHYNEVIDFGKDGIYVNSNELHNYSWSVTKRNKRIAKLSKDIEKRKLPVIIICKTAAEGTAAANRMMEVMEKDCLAMEPGSILIGNYYLKCFVTESKKNDYLINKRYMKVDLSVESDNPFWIKESTTAFRPSSGGSLEGDFLDYPFDYPFDFSNALIRNELNNTNFVSSNFVITIYGSCTNPSIIIGDHTYSVNCTVNEGEFLVIDSTAKTIMLQSNDGTKVSQFNNRNRNSYIFEKIPAGRSVVTWSGSYSFDVILKEERSEPKWT